MLRAIALRTARNVYIHQLDYLFDLTNTDAI